MKENKLKGKITILVGRERTTIEIRDDLSSENIVEVELTPEQLSEALSRMMYTECTINSTCQHPERIGKKMITKRITVRLHESVNTYTQERLRVIADKNCPEDYVPDYYFNSQNTFTYEGDKLYLNYTVRTWK